MLHSALEGDTMLQGKAGMLALASVRPVVVQTD